MAHLALPNDIMQDKIACHLSFIDTVNFQKSSKLFNGCFAYRHDPRLDDQCAIQKAAAAGNTHAVACLLKVPYVDASFNSNYAIKAAANIGNVDIVRLLLNDKNVRLSLDYNHLLYNAAFAGNTGIVQLILSSPNLSGLNCNRALVDAADQGHAETVLALLADPRVDPAASAYNAWRHAIYGNHLPVTERMLADGRINPSVLNNIAIQTCIHRGQIYREMFQLLLRDPRLTSEDLRIALRAALWEKDGGSYVQELMNDYRVFSNISPSDIHVGMQAAQSLKGDYNNIIILLSNPHISTSLILNLKSDFSVTDLSPLVPTLLSLPQISQTVMQQGLSSTLLESAVTVNDLRSIRLVLHDCRTKFTDSELEEMMRFCKEAGNMEALHELLRYQNEMKNLLISTCESG